MQNACLSALSSRALSLLGSHLREAIFRAGSILWPVTTPLSEVYFPSSGLISILVPVSDGALIEVGSICRQAAVGAIFDPSHSHTQGVVEIGGSFTCISAQKLFSAAKENSEIRDLVHYCREWILMQAQQTAACNAVHPADERFCRWLSQACERMDTNTVSLTQDTIASLLGIRRTTVTLIAQMLQAEGLIQYRRGKIAILDWARLRAQACECCNPLGREHWPSTRLLNATVSNLYRES
jgi:CRP-like cAMP-binding protein